MPNAPRPHFPLPYPQKGILHSLYTSVPGRVCLRLLVRPKLSRLAGRFLDTRFSAVLISGFIRRNAIDMTPYPARRYTSFNDFFTRRISPAYRPIDREPTHLIAPCDAKLTVYPLTETGTFTVKDSVFTAAELLQNEALAQKFYGGWCFLFRLCVDDYHRYHFADGGTQEEPVFLPGVLHTVQPVALEHGRIYHRNSRVYTLLHTEQFGDLVQVEVGALLVGKVVNRPVHRFVRGEEKGHFAYGGSTIALLVPAHCVQPDEDLLANTRAAHETVVRLGEKIGVRAE